MSLVGALQLVAGIAAGIAIGWVIVHASWRVHGAWKIHRAGPRALLAARHRIWREPSARDVTDLRYGPGGADGVPAPPFTFDEELTAGSQPSVAVRDARGRRWRVKWGHEAKPESFAVRVAHACGYFAEVTHYVAEGMIADCGSLSRARDSIAEDGRFEEARFELEDRGVRMLFDEHSWAWNDNPFVGTRQLAGLRILIMLLSNWDTKDRRDVARGSNTAIFEHRLSRFSREARYLITDWGGAMGKWGATVVSRGRWDVDGFEAQSVAFVTGVTDGWVNFGYQGQRTAEIARNISVEDVRWFHRHVSRIPDRALHEALVVCGATEDEAGRFAAALRQRIDQLGGVAGATRSTPLHSESRAGSARPFLRA